MDKRFVLFKLFLVKHFSLTNKNVLHVRNHVKVELQITRKRSLSHYLISTQITVFFSQIYIIFTLFFTSRGLTTSIIRLIIVYRLLQAYTQC